jgi:hypothetical protein
MRILGLLLALMVVAGAQDVLTNDAVSKMVKAGLGESVIISMIQSQPGKYSLSPDDLLKLKQDGASDKVLAAMVSKGPASAASAPPSVPAVPASPLAPTPAPSVAPAPIPGVGAHDLRAVRKIYVDKLDNDLDQYLRAEFFKQMKGRVAVVLEEKDADAILTGVSEEEKGTGAKITGRYFGLHDVATGSLSLLDKERKVILWSDEAGDRNLIFSAAHRGGERKVAQRLIGKLKKAMGY